MDFQLQRFLVPDLVDVIAKLVHTSYIDDINSEILANRGDRFHQFGPNSNHNDETEAETQTEIDNWYELNASYAHDHTTQANDDWADPYTADEDMSCMNNDQFTEVDHDGWYPRFLVNKPSLVPVFSSE